MSLSKTEIFEKRTGVVNKSSHIVWAVKSNKKTIVLTESQNIKKIAR
jgi:hypothetical protein